MEKSMMWNRKEISYKIDKNGCFICDSHKNKTGHHPMIHRNGRTMTVAKYIYENRFGKIPKGMILRHKCNNGNCINPYHLEIGTYKDNYNDSKKIATNAFGEKHGRSKLKRNEVNDILKSKLSTTDLSYIYEVHVSTIRRIKRGLIWKH